MTDASERFERAVACAYSAAGGAGTGALTWAQQFMIEVIAATGTTWGNFDIFLTHDLIEPLTVDAAVALVRRFVVRHPVLRTSISYGADGVPVQHVHDAGRLVIPVYQSQDPLSMNCRPAVPATTLESAFGVLFAAQGDTVVRIAMRISHLLADAHGAHVLSGALAELAAEEPESGADERWSASPLDLTLFEASAEGQRVQRRSLEHAEAVYGAAPETMWRRRRTPQADRYWLGDLRSTDLLVSLDRLQENLNVTRAGALIGALAAVTAFQAGIPDALLFLIASNRFDPAWTTYPGLLTQEAVLCLPVGETVRETMRAATVVSMRSLRKARYAPAEMEKVRQAVAKRRGGITFDGLGTAVVLNLLSVDASVASVRPSAVPTTFRWRDTTNDENLGLYIDAYQIAEGFVLGGRFDTALLTPTEAEELLRAVEWTIISAAARDVPIGELHAYLTG